MITTKFKGKEIKLTNKQVDEIAEQDPNCHLWTIAAKSQQKNYILKLAAILILHYIKELGLVIVNK